MLIGIAAHLVAFSLFVGSPFVAADHGGRSRAAVMRLVLKRAGGLGS
jgi:hypothetical protein